MKWSGCVFLIAMIVNVGMVEGSIVTNGNFETRNLNGWTTEGWTWSSDASVPAAA